MGVMQPPTQQYNHKSTAERADAPRHAVDSTTSMFIPPVSSAEQGPLRRDGPARSGRKGKVVSIGYMAQWRYRLFLDRLIVRDGANSTVRPPYGVIGHVRGVWVWVGQGGGPFYSHPLLPRQVWQGRPGSRDECWIKREASKPGAHSPTGARLGRSLFSMRTPLHLSVRVYLVRWRSAGGKQVLKHGGSEVPSRIPLTTHHTHLLQRDRPVCIYSGCRGAVPCRVVAAARLLCASGRYSWNTMAAYPPSELACDASLIVLTAGFV